MTHRERCREGKFGRMILCMRGKKLTFSWLTVTYELIGASGKFSITGIKGQQHITKASGNLVAVCINWAWKVTSLMVDNVIIKKKKKKAFFFQSYLSVDRSLSD